MPRQLVPFWKADLVVKVAETSFRGEIVFAEEKKTSSYQYRSNSQRGMDQLQKDQLQRDQLQRDQLQRDQLQRDQHPPWPESISRPCRVGASPDRP